MQAPPRDHDEWLLDESLQESFPASDPPAPAIERLRTPRRPGSDVERPDSPRSE